MVPTDKFQYSDKESKQRFEAALKGAMSTSPKPLKDKPKTRNLGKVEAKPTKAQETKR